MSGNVVNPSPAVRDENGIREQARVWLLRVAEAPHLAAECDRWRAEDERHEAAFQEARNVWETAPNLSTVLGDDWRYEAERLGRSPMARARHWATTGPRRMLLPAALAASLVAALLLPQVSDTPSRPLATDTAQVRTVSLEDGSRLTLGARSAVKIRFEEGSRRVVLDEGQAFFEVAHDAGRPFTVVAGDAEIRVTGTKFDVRRFGDDVRVAVLEGRVELRRKPLLPLLHEDRPDRVLTAGERSELDGDNVFTPETRALVTPGEWRSGRLYYSEAPLGEIVADVQRYSERPIRIGDERVRRMKVTTSFRASDIDRFVENLEATLPIKGERKPDGSIVLAGR